MQICADLIKRHSSYAFHNPLKYAQKEQRTPLRWPDAFISRNFKIDLMAQRTTNRKNSQRKVFRALTEL